MAESYYDTFVKSTQPADLAALKKKLSTSTSTDEQKVINTSNEALIALLLTKDVTQYLNTLLPLTMTDQTYLSYNKAVAFLLSNKPSEALGFLSDHSSDEESPVRFFSLLLYYHIVTSLRSLTPDLTPITDEFMNPIYVPGTLFYIQSQLVLLRKALKENNISQAITHITGVCNSSRDPISKPYYQSLLYYLSNDFESSQSALLSTSSPLKDNNTACTFFRSGKPAVAIYMIQKSFDLFARSPDICKTTLDAPTSTVYPIGWKQTVTYNLGLCYLLANNPTDAHTAFLTLVDYYRYNPLLWYRLASCVIMANYNMKRGSAFNYKYVSCGATRHVVILQNSQQSESLPLSLGMQYIRNMATLLRGSTDKRMLTAMHYCMGYIAFYSEDYEMAKFCFENVYATAKETVKQSARVFLARAYCLLGLNKEADKVLQEFFVEKSQENTDINFTLALSLLMLKKYEDALKIVEKMEDSEDANALKVFILLLLGKKELAANVVRKSSPIRPFKDCTFVSY
ncbi:hypothetical protein EIN_508100 [Entamoeba invadens IP1]|uniref:Uncharacterized protein n=1 Tax=Entamoeba invadens IP1 TaxID=370355 RepID=A0A0A1UGN3_ENTIV|nr:hypothetical protein EIN_508100 [Entamoeba invadens IP1]ELP92859.1 hypothetical protein EIN_508100 [Entamoeba invadens IP1]|eukprot:XP_004259630.1 hypothetical protein EIN_508100 [Entamoeba invadens IP1]